MAGLSGYWTGWFDYGEGRGVTHFGASVVARAGEIEGATLELDGEGHELEALLEGEHAAGYASFTKFYSGGGPSHAHPVEYAGEINSAGTRITGQWTIEGDEEIFGTSISFVGNFAMQKVSPLPRVASRTRASVSVKR